MLEAIEIMYHEGCIPYISDVNKNCLDKLLWYIEDAKKKTNRYLFSSMVFRFWIRKDYSRLKHCI